MARIWCVCLRFVYFAGHAYGLVFACGWIGELSTVWTVGMLSVWCCIDLDNSSG